MFIINPYIFSAAGYSITHSLGFNRSADEYLQRAISGSSTLATKGTFSAWIKRTVLGTAAQGIFGANNTTAGASGGHDVITFNASDQINIYLAAGADDVTWSPKFRDTSAFYHFVIAIDTTQSTDTNRIKFYVNGVQVTDTASANWPAEDQVMRGFAYASGTTTQVIGTDMNHSSTASRNEAGFILGGDAIWVDGSALAPTDFGEFNEGTGIWVPIEPSVTYGNHGFRLQFQGSDVGTDTSGEGNNWTAKTTLGTNNVVADTCTNKDDEEIKLYPALNPLTKNSSINLTNANLTHTGTDGDIDTNTKVNFALPSTGKFYFEFVAGGSSGLYLGVVVGSCANNESGNGANKGFLYNQSNGKLYANPITAGSGDAYGDTWTTNDVIGVAIDMTNGGDMWFSKNDTWQNSATASEIAAGTTTNAAVTNMPTNTTNSRTYDGSGLFVSIGDSSAGGTGTLRFASGSWTGTAPTGFGELTRTITGVGNYARINPEAVNTAGNSDVTLSANNLKAVYVADHAAEFSIARLTSGKHYWELTNHTNQSGSTGVIQGSYYGSLDRSANLNSTGIYYYNPFSGNKMKDGSGTSYGNSVGANDCLQVALDLDNDKIWWGINNTWQNSGDPAAGSNEAYSDLTDTDYTPVVGYGAAYTSILNTGQTPLKYSPPTGFKALNSANMPTPTITKSTDYCDAIQYTGTGSELEISSLSFQPGLVLIKNLDATDDWLLFDNVNGVTKHTSPNRSDLGGLVTTAQSLKSFDSDGFTLGTDNQVNTSSEKYVAFSWKTGSSGTVTNGMTKVSDSSQTNITRAVNADSGVSIMSYTGNGSASTIVHGLNSTPKFLFVMPTDQNGVPLSWHDGLNSNRSYRAFGATGNKETWGDDRQWGADPATSTVIGVGLHTGVNDNGDTYTAYAFADVEGFSKFSSYTGNGTTDGPFVYTGFRPSIIWIAGLSGSANWAVYNDVQNANSYGNPADRSLRLSSNETDANLGSSPFDIYSNGFKSLTGAAEHNASGVGYIYMAWARSPFASNNRAR